MRALLLAVSSDLTLGLIAVGGFAAAVLLFWVFVVLFIVGLVMHLAGGRSTSL